MAELKTLKDMKWHYFDQGVLDSGDYAKIAELKQEVIKWYKYLEGVGTEHDVWDFIKTFFNLKEEDLK